MICSVILPGFQKAYFLNNKNGKLYIMTSGTTGRPKAIIICLDRLWSSALAFENIIKNLIRIHEWNYLPMSYLEVSITFVIFL